ncbi:binary cytotoxin component [Pseudomonas sp. v388]|nr:binary cytotoxin component [Pseudomonas sp. v388]
MTDEESGGRGAALLLTKEDVLSLKRYERFALSLPHTLETVQRHLGITSSGLPGLEPADIMNTHCSINIHALGWTAIEAKIKDAGYQLDEFARNFTNQGGRVLQIIEGMDSFTQIVTRVDELTEQLVEQAAPTQLNATDRRIVGGLSDYLSLLARNIELQRVAATSLKDQIASFVATIQTELMPDISQKLSLVKKSDLERQIKELTADMDALSKEIGQKNKEYTAAKNNIAWGVFGGPIGVAITGGIFGSKAEKIRKEKNRLIREKNKIVAQINTKQPISAAIRRLELQFEDMDIRLIDAHQSATNLQDLWAMMTTCIKNSADDLANISDSQSLLMFALQFRSVIRPWHTIQGYTTRLLQIFQSALDQYKLEQR